MNAVAYHTSQIPARPHSVPLVSFAEKVLLQVERLRKAFGRQVVLNEVALELHRGKVVLCGDNGSGKTTLLHDYRLNLK